MILANRSGSNGIELYYIERPDKQKIGYRCYMENKNDRIEFVEAIGKIDWENANFDVYATVPYDENQSGPVFSPAFNSFWLVYSGADCNEDASLKLWFCQAALADGTPSAGYFGLSYDTPILSRRGIPDFSPFADENNFYRVVIKKNPLTIQIESFHHQLDPELQHPYIIVTSIFEPATTEEISKTVGKIGVKDMWGIELLKASAMIVKGALMEEILSAYYPDASYGQLFSIMKDPDEQRSHISEELMKGSTHADVVKSIPLSMNKAVVGNLLGAFSFFFSNRHGIWILPPTIEDTDEETTTRKRKNSKVRQAEAKDNLILRLNDIKINDQCKDITY